VPMHDYNARIVVFGAHGEQARQVAEELAQGAFHNVAYFGGSFEAFQAAVAGAPSHADIGERFVAIFNEQDASIADEIFAPDFVAHVTGSPTPTLDREGWKAYLEAFRASFPDLRLEVRDVITTEDMVILRVVLHGTQTGAFQDLPPSGKSVAFDGVAIHRIEDGQVVEHWGVMDLLSLMQQLTADAEPTANPRSMAVETVEASREEANKAFIRRYLEAISGQPKTEAMLREFIANEVLIEHVKVFEAAFPRYELDIEDMMAEGDKVVIRALLRGVHSGELFGVPATGNRVEVPGILIYRIENGKVAEFWLQADVMSLMQQLGARP
jgi:steroid delta-isomerase-like uncharacterized protein